MLSSVDLDGMPVDVDYGHVYVVIREGEDGPSPTDWEANITTEAFVPVTAARHDLALTAPDGSCMRGAAIVRFSDGHRHLFRGDADLEGFERTTLG